MLNHSFRQSVVHEGLRSTSAKAAELLTAPLSFPLSLSHHWTGAPLKPRSSGPSPNYRALGGLLFIPVKALTPYCAVVSGWIQHRAMLCRAQLFYAWVGWLGGSGSGHIFQIRLDGLTISLHHVCVLHSLSLSVWEKCVTIVRLLLRLFFYIFICWLLFCPLKGIFGRTYGSCFCLQIKPDTWHEYSNITLTFFTYHNFSWRLRWFPSSYLFVFSSKESILWSIVK